jgi:hypothetical protein
MSYVTSIPKNLYGLEALFWSLSGAGQGQSGRQGDADVDPIRLLRAP